MIEWRKINDKIAFNTLRIYITIYDTYLLLYCKWHIQIRINNSIINVETKTIDEQIDKIAFNIFRIYIAICHTYPLLYCKGHSQMRSNDSNINVKTKNNRVNKMIKKHSVHFEFTSQYITLTSYYIVKDTFRWELMTAT